MQEVTSNPPQEQINKLAGLYHAGQLIQAERACINLLQTYPQSIAIANILAFALQGQGKLQAALQVFDRAIQLDPDQAETHSNRSNVLAAMGQLEMAVESCNRAITLKPDYVEAYVNRGNALGALGRLQESVESFDRALSIRPDIAEAHNNRGNALRDMGLLDKAVESYDRAVVLKPGYAEAHNNRGNALHELSQLKEAMASLNRAIELKPDYALAYCNRGNILRDLGRLNDAISDYDRAISYRLDYVDAYNDRGNAYFDLGLFDKAIESYEAAIRIQPGFAKGYRHLGHLKTYQQGDPQIARMEDLLANMEPGIPGRKHLCFALAKAYEDLEEYDKSFKYLSEGNQLRKKELNYNIDNDRKDIDKVKVIFQHSGLIPVIQLDGATPFRPIFIVGMPRSGTSLVEQILASHSQVFGAGELKVLNQLAHPVFSELPNHELEGEWKNFYLEKIAQVRQGYIEALSGMGIGEPVVTDKMPLNFIWLGFIMSTFPEARVIHLKRDPMATCWSIYKRLFSSDGNGYAYDFSNLAQFYRLYLDLMSFWHERYPDRIYDLSYEKLTENQEIETRRLLKFCDLEWQEQCLNFHKTKRAVKTASAPQVRKKLYRGSSEAWRKYEKHLKPLIHDLEYTDI